MHFHFVENQLQIYWISSKINIRKHKIYNTHAHKFTNARCWHTYKPACYSGQTLLTSGSSRRLYSHNLGWTLLCPLQFLGAIYKPVQHRCRDVQHTSLQSTQTRRNYSSNNIGKQVAQTRTQHIFPSIPTTVAALHV